MTTTPSIYTQIPAPVLERLKQKFNNYENTPFTFIETSHRSKQYDQLNNNTIQLLKSYFNASDYVCMLFPSGAAIPSLCYNFPSPDMQMYFYVNGHMSYKCYKQMLKYNKNTQKIKRLQEVLNYKNRSNRRQIFLHLNEMDNGAFLPQSESMQLQDIITIKNINYCFPWPKDKKLSAKIAYFDTQTGYSVPGFTVIFVHNSIFSSLKKVQKCPDILSYLTMQQKKSIVNTPFTLCNLVLNQNIRYGIQKRQQLQSQIKKNRINFINKIKQLINLQSIRSIDINKHNCFTQSNNMITIIINNLDKQVGKDIIDNCYGWKIEDNMYSFFIQASNHNIQQFVQKIFKKQ